MAANHSVSHPVSVLRAPPMWWQDLGTRAFGYDIFVSFALTGEGRSTLAYASDLARRLRELDMSVFFSEEEMSPGDELAPSLQKALLKSRALVVVVNRATLRVPGWIRTEVQLFRRERPRRKVIVLAVDNAFDDPQLCELCADWLPVAANIRVQEHAQLGEPPLPSDEVITRMMMVRRFWRARRLWRGLVVAVVLSLMTSSIIAAWQAVAAKEQARLARASELEERKARERADDQTEKAKAAEGVAKKAELAASAAASSERQSRIDAQKAEATAVQERSRAEDRLRTLYAEQGQLELLNGRWPAAALLLAQAAKMSGGTIESEYRTSLELAFAPLSGVLDVLHGDSTQMLSASFSKDGTRVSAGQASGTATVWDRRSGAVVARLTAQAPIVLAVWMDVTGRRLLTLSAEPKVEINEQVFMRKHELHAELWDVDKGRRLQHWGASTNLDVDEIIDSGPMRPTADSTRIVLWHADSEASAPPLVADVNTGKELEDVEASSLQTARPAKPRSDQRQIQAVSSLHGGSGRILARAADDNVWAATGGDSLLSIVKPRSLRSTMARIPEIKPLSMAFDANSTGLRIVSAKGSLLWYSLTAGSLSSNQPTIEVPMASATIAPGATRVVVETAKGLSLVDATNAKVLVNVSSRDSIHGFSISALGRYMVYWSGDNGTGDNRPAVRIRALDTGRLVKEASAIGPIELVAVDEHQPRWIAESETQIQGDDYWSEDPHLSEPQVVRYASGKGEQAKWVTGLADGSVSFDANAKGVPAHAAAVKDLCLGSTGGTVVSLSTDGDAAVWDRNSKRLLRWLRGAGQGSLHCSADGSVALIGERVAKLWDTQTGREIHRFDARSEILAKALSPDGRHFAIATKTGILVWSRPSGTSNDQTGISRVEALVHDCILANGGLGTWSTPQKGQRRGQCTSNAGASAWRAFSDRAAIPSTAQSDTPRSLGN